MLRLTDREWKEFKVGELFSIKTGKSYNKNKMNIAESGLRHISRATNNHGIDCYADISEYNIYEKYKGNCITVSSIPYQQDGTCAFYQDKEFCCGVGVNILTAKWLNAHNALFICTCINNAVVGKYGMARSLGASMLKEEKLLLPVSSIGSPDYDFMEQYIREREPDYSWVTRSIAEHDSEVDWEHIEDHINTEANRLKLTERNWTEFKVKDIFNFTRGKRITTAFAEENIGNIPVIAGGDQNNGILCYLDEKCANTRVLKDNCITVAAYGTAGCVHYHGYKCFIDDKAIALNINDNKYNKDEYANLFMTGILSTLKDHYSYGRGVTVDRYGDEVVKLPINSQGQPDYEFMHSYIKEGVSLALLEFKKTLES